MNNNDINTFRNERGELLSREPKMRRGNGHLLARAMALVLILGCATPRLHGEEKTENFPDGSPHLVYHVNSAGAKEGLYKELTARGTPSVLATYRAGKLNGPYKRFYPTGKLKISAVYANDRLVGKYTQYAANCALLKTVNYNSEGRKHGVTREFVDGRLERDQLWIDGQLIVPKSAQRIAQELAAIQTMPITFEGECPPVSAKIAADLRDPERGRECEAAFRTLLAYRFLCDVPYRDLTLDRSCIAHAQAGADILSRVNSMTHAPKNPGLPDAEYQFGYAGTINSNIGNYQRSLIDAVKAYMSEEANIEPSVGHRRWCLNPSMSKTGFGYVGKWQAMWALDRGREHVPDFDYVAFPPRGLTPVEVFDARCAWSVSLNTAKFKPTNENNVTVTIWPARLAPQKPSLEPHAGKPLDVMRGSRVKVSLESYGIPNCIIFRPKGVKVAANAAYWVENRGPAANQWARYDRRIPGRLHFAGETRKIELNRIGATV